MAMNSRRVAWICGAAGALAMVSVAGTTLAQGQPKDNVLGGPKVKDNSLPGAKSRFSTGKGDKKDRALDRGIPPGVYMRALDVLRGDDVSDSVRLTAEQDAQIREIHEQFMGAERQYMQSHRDELAALRKDLPPEMRQRVDERLRNAKGFEKGLPKDNAKKARKGKAAPDADAMQDSMQDEPMTDRAKPDPGAAAKARERMEQLFNEAPKPKDAQAKVWALLTSAQRPVLQAEIERLQKDGAKGGKPGGPDGPGGALTPEMREKLKNMSPEERRQFIQEMREKRGGKRPQGGSDKPPPKRDSLKMPKPDDNEQGPE